MTPGRWVWFAISSAISLALLAVFGYLVGGPWAALALTVAFVVGTATATLLALRRRNLSASSGRAPTSSG